VTEIAEELVPIGLRLRFVLFGLESALGVSFAGAECERIFLDATADQVSAKRYAIFTSPHLTVTGRVNDYEPETISLRVEGNRSCGSMLRRIVQASEFAVYRMEKPPAE
jgi:hypothetical protein